MKLQEKAKQKFGGVSRKHERNRSIAKGGKIPEVLYSIVIETSNKNNDALKELTDRCLNVRILIDELHAAFEATKEALTTAKNALGNFAIDLFRFLLQFGENGSNKLYQCYYQ